MGREAGQCTIKAWFQLFKGWLVPTQGYIVIMFPFSFVEKHFSHNGQRIRHIRQYAVIFSLIVNLWRNAICAIRDYQRDLGSLNRHKYLISTDYFEVLPLKKNTKAPPPPLIIRELKDTFSRFGNPKGVSDGGPQFTCKAFETSPNNGFSNTLLACVAGGIMWVRD